MHMMAESYKNHGHRPRVGVSTDGQKIGLTDRKVFDAAYTAELKVLEPRLDIKPIAIQATSTRLPRPIHAPSK